MSDNLKNTGPQDRSRINLNEDWEVKYWTKTLAVSSIELQQVIKKVGTAVKNVRKELKK